MKKLVLTTLALMMTVSSQAKMIYGRYTVSKNKNGIEREWDSDLKGYRVTEYAVIEVKYNTVTNRGSIRSLNEYCTDNTVALQFKDADGLMIDGMEAAVGFFFYNEMLGAYDYDDKTQRRLRSQITRISVLDDSGCIDTPQSEEIVCNRGREYNEATDRCERVCDDNHFYDYDSDKCIKLLDSKDESGEWCQKADGEWYFDNNVKNGKCPKVKVKKDLERETAYGAGSSESHPGYELETTGPWYSSADGRWHCDAPYEFDGQGGCFLLRRGK